MATVRTFCCIILLVAFGRSGVFGSGIVIIRKENKYERVIEIAHKEIGVRERTGRNDGQRIAEYLAYVGIREAAPYCAAWLSWVFGQVGYKVPRTAWSPALFPASRVVKEAEPGYVFGLYYTSLGRIGHCGLVARLQGDNLYTIEANTSLPGSREGDGVYARVRHKRTIYRFADWLK